MPSFVAKMAGEKEMRLHLPFQTHAQPWALLALPRHQSALALAPPGQFLPL